MMVFRVLLLVGVFAYTYGYSQIEISSYVEAVQSEVEQANDSIFASQYSAYLKSTLILLNSISVLKETLADSTLSQAKLAFTMNKIETEEQALLDLKHTYYAKLRTQYLMDVVAQIYLIDQINLTSLLLKLELK